MEDHERNELIDSAIRLLSQCRRRVSLICPDIEEYQFKQLLLNVHDMLVFLVSERLAHLRDGLKGDPVQTKKAAGD